MSGLGTEIAGERWPIRLVYHCPRCNQNLPEKDHRCTGRPERDYRNREAKPYDTVPCGLRGYTSLGAWLGHVRWCERPECAAERAGEAIRRGRAA